MRESFIMRLCFLGSLIGLFLIFMIVSQLEYSNVKIGSITGEMVGETINITCVVIDKYNHQDGHLFLDAIDETGQIKIVIWSDNVKTLNETIEKGSIINVIGNIQLYKGEYEVIARKVKVIKQL